MIIKTSESWKLKSTVWRSWRPFKTSIRASFSLIDRSETIERSAGVDSPAGRLIGHASHWGRRRRRLKGAPWHFRAKPWRRLSGSRFLSWRSSCLSVSSVALFLIRFACWFVRVSVGPSVLSPSVWIFLSETVCLSVYLLAALYVLFIVIIISSLFPGFPSTIGANEK